MKKQGKASDTGNVVVDLGEAIERRLARAGLGAGGLRQDARPYRRGGWQPARTRPGSTMGARGWYGDKMASLGDRWAVFESLGVPRSVNVAKLAAGGLIGLLGGRGLVRLTSLVGPLGKFRPVHEGIAAFAGTIPAMVSMKSSTVGVAVPGVILFAASLVDAAFDWLGVPPTGLHGGADPGQGAVGEARQKLDRLADVQRRLQPRAGIPQVAARPA